MATPPSIKKEQQPDRQRHDERIVMNMLQSMEASYNSELHPFLLVRDMITAKMSCAQILMCLKNCRVREALGRQKCRDEEIYFYELSLKIYDDMVGWLSEDLHLINYSLVVDGVIVVPFSLHYTDKQEILDLFAEALTDNPAPDRVVVLSDQSDTPI
jgi:hypothetical protein